MKRILVSVISLCVFALLAPPVGAQQDSPQQSSRQEETRQQKDKFDKAGNATEGAIEKAGEATGKGVGAAVEHTGRGVTTAAKATAGAMEKTGEAIADFFDGDEGDENRVREVQRALQEKGYYSGNIDGIVGPKTRAGVREYQQDEQLPVTGKVDEKTAERLGVE